MSTTAKPPRKPRASSAPQKRGSITKSASTFIGGYMPTNIAALIDTAAIRADSDKSKWLRNAVRAQLKRDGLLSA